MAKEGTGKYTRASSQCAAGNFYVPARVAGDSAFPFQGGEDPHVAVVGETVVFSKDPKGGKG